MFHRRVVAPCLAGPSSPCQGNRDVPHTGCYQRVYLLTNVVIQDWLELLTTYLCVDRSEEKQGNIQAKHTVRSRKIYIALVF